MRDKEPSTWVLESGETRGSDINLLKITHLGIVKKHHSPSFQLGQFLYCLSIWRCGSLQISALCIMILYPTLAYCDFSHSVSDTDRTSTGWHCISLVFFFILLNLLGWHCLIKLYRFQVCSSIIHHLHIIWGSPPKVNSPPITIYQPLTLFYPPPLALWYNSNLLWNFTILTKISLLYCHQEKYE